MKVKRRRIPEVQFTAQERLALQLPQGKEPIKGHDAAALRKIIDMFPWMLDVAGCNFDGTVARGYLVAESKMIEAKVLKARLLKDYVQRRSQNEKA